MNNFYPPLGLAIGGMLLYHLCQKSVPKGINPFFATIIAYLVGSILCLICALGYSSSKSFAESVKGSNWAVLGVGLAIFGTELGFLLAYRAGWKISTAALVTNVSVTVLLVPIGIALFKEQLSSRNIAGLVFCFLGLLLLGRN